MDALTYFVSALVNRVCFSPFSLLAFVMPHTSMSIEYVFAFVCIFASCAFPSAYYDLSSPI